MKGILQLEDGKRFFGEASSEIELIGEVIFNTAVVGYQELMTDPVNAGKILVLTYPLIGNYGINPKFNESKKTWIKALVIKEKSRIYSNWQAKSSLDDFIKKNNLFLLHKVDTRSLMVDLRNKGEQLGIISTSTFEPKILLAKIEAFKKSPKRSLLNQISVKKPLFLGKKGTKKIAILDLGITQSILKQLETLGFSLVIFPYSTSIQAMLKYKIKGLIISSGPEQDLGLEEVVKNIKSLIGRIPILGIGTGCQVLAEALGAKIIKLKLGHHGLNYPLARPATYKGEITVQNHSYVIDTDSLNRIKEIKITGYNLNDRSVEEIESKKFKLIGVQYIPASPGFNEVNPILKRFVKML